MTKIRDNKGGRPKLADYQKRTKLVRIMFCENDFIYIQSKASKAGLSVSEYCHQAAMDNHIRETISPEMAKQIRDLSGIANNVNQIAHQMHIDGPDNEEGNALMAEIAKEWLKRMRIVNTQFIIARHHDTKHPHCHIVYNIIDNDGNVLSDRNERYRSARICRALTEEYGLYIARKNSKEQNLNRLRPQQMKKAQLKTAVLDARQASNNWESFIAELSKRHIEM